MVLQVAVLILPSLDLPSWTYNLVLGLLVLGFPIALVLAWALTVTPEGEVTRVRPTMAGLQGAGAGQSAAPPDARSLAVLPFTNLSADAENEYFSDGVTEEIIASLSKVRDLRVISRTSAMRFKGTDKGIEEIAAALGVAHIVEGSVRRSRDRVRITAQLIDARTDSHLWAESYDRDLEDIFAIQSDVAERIARSLQATLTPSEKVRIEAAPTADTKAYELYLRGRHQLVRRTEESMLRAIDLLDRALAIDPNFAKAWASRAESWAVAPTYASTPIEESIREARVSARRALELDSGLGQAHAALGLAAELAGDPEEAEREYRRALDLDPNAPLALHWYANFLGRRKRFDDAIALLQRALEIDPLSLPVHMGLAVVLMWAGRWAESEAVLRRALEIDPGFAITHRNFAELLESQDRYEEAIEEHAAVARGDPRRLPPEEAERLREAYERGGPEGYWQEWTEVSRRRPSPEVRLDGLARALVRLNRVEEAIAVLEEATAQRLSWTLHIPVEYGRALDSHPRFQALVARIQAGR